MRWYHYGLKQAFMNLCEKISKHMINLLDLNYVWFLRPIVKSDLTTEDCIKIYLLWILWLFLWKLQVCTLTYFVILFTWSTDINEFTDF
jgi:hypothetical protein